MYTYTLDGNAANPLGEWSLGYRKNAGQVFYRRVMIGELIFKGSDYEYIINQSDCTEVELIIYCRGEVYWTGNIKVPFGINKIDADQCALYTTPEVVDEYSCIMENYETEYELVAPPIVAISPILTDCLGGNIHNFVANWCRLVMTAPPHT